jgi:ubiquinone/menaquinone biosynthesis C-methylase UbiE
VDINEKIKKRYNRISRIYKVMDGMIKEEWRLNLLSNVTGKVLEVGIGTGSNLSFYPHQIFSLTGVDFSKGMLKHAEEKVSKGYYPFSIQLMEADVQALPFPDNTFDSVVSTCVFCSVSDPMVGLKELRRVCKPNGRIYMLEHMRSNHKLVGIVMDMLNPITVRLWGANINRETLKTIEGSGLKIQIDSSLRGSILRKLAISPNKK